MFGGRVTCLCVGNCRITSTVDDNILVVAVITPGHRRDVYDR